MTEGWLGGGSCSQGHPSPAARELPSRGATLLQGRTLFAPCIPLPIVIAYLKLFVGGARCAPPSADAPCNLALLQNLWFIVGTNHKRGTPLKSQEQSCAKSDSHPCENCPKAGDIAPVTNLSSPAGWCKIVNMPKFCYTHPGVRFARKSSQKSRKSLDSKPFTLYTETVSQKWNRAP